VLKWSCIVDAATKETSSQFWIVGTCNFPVNDHHFNLCIYPPNSDHYCSKHHLFFVISIPGFAFVGAPLEPGAVVYYIHSNGLVF
jgi:hypothetical protein